MAKLVNKGFYYELQEDNHQLFASILNGLAGGLTNVLQMRQQKKLQDAKLQETRLDMQAKINALDPDIQENLLQSSPELRRFLIDPQQLKLDPEQKKALDQGLITPMMPKIRGRTPLEQATLLERQEGARKETGLANKAEQEALLQTDVTAQRRGLMKSDNPYEQILGLTGEVMTSDKLEAMMTGINDPKAAFTKYMSNVPGTLQFKTQAAQKAEAQLLSDINPQTPEEMQAVKDAAQYVAGLGPMPKKMPKTMQRKGQELDAWRIRVQEQGNQISNARLNMETNGKIHALGDQLSLRLRGTGREGSAFSIAEGMVRFGKFPSDLPPDVMAIADQEHKLLNINMDKLKYEQQLQQSPKLQMLLDLAGKSATAGDDKGAQQYVKMAEQERRKIYGEDKPDPNERKRFWNTVLSAGTALAGPAGAALAPMLANTSVEQKAAMLKWAGSTADEIKEALAQVPGQFMDAASKGLVTSPGQRGLTPDNNKMLEPGNIDLYARPKVKNTDGSISTVRSLGVNIDGKEVLIPTVSDDGKILSDEEAIEVYKKTGRHLGKFGSVAASNRYAEQLHNDYAAGKYDQRPTPTGSTVAPKQLPASAPAPTTSGGRLSQDQVQAMENMLRDIDKMSVNTLTPQKRDELLTLLQMIEEVKAGKRPFADLITPDY
jgi:hypothetical protein